eukprot:scaffold2014_cov213-Chaetoceros_neogracile.AAC.4
MKGWDDGGTTHRGDLPTSNFQFATCYQSPATSYDSNKAQNLKHKKLKTYKLMHLAPPLLHNP